MKLRMLVVLGALALISTACEKKQETQVAQPQVQQEESGTDRKAGEPGESQVESGQAPTVGQIREERQESAAATEAAKESAPEAQGKAAPADQIAAGPEKTASEPSKDEKQKKAAEKPAAGKPKAGSKGPETVVLQNKNGDVSFPHQAHQQLTDCKTCHGDKTPGKVDLNRDSGHKLCLGCHKEQGAGPTSCTGCHKKG